MYMQAHHSMKTMQTQAHHFNDNVSCQNGCCCFQCIRTQEVGVVEDFGQFKRLLEPGLHFLCCPIQQVVGRLSLRIQQLDVTCETKTKDNVFVQIAVAVQFRILLSSAYDAFYRLSSAHSQIQSYVFDVVRSTVPKLELDAVFASKKDIADAVLHQLEEAMKQYGYEIRNTLVTDISPNSLVKASMNEINAAKRLKEAASHKAEAAKTKQVKDAEADAEARYLSGLGVARQRKAIIEGLQGSVIQFSNEVAGATPKDVMDILLLSQYFDTLSVVGSNHLFIQHDPSTVPYLQDSIRQTFLKNSHANPIPKATAVLTNGTSSLKASNDIVAPLLTSHTDADMIDLTNGNQNAEF